MLAITAIGFGLITAAVSKDANVAGGLSMIFILPRVMFGALLSERRMKVNEKDVEK